MLSKKIAVVILYFLLCLSFFELKDIILSPTLENLEKILFCLSISLAISYTNGFKLFRMPYNTRKD